MGIGRRMFFRLAADQVITSQATPQTVTGFSFAVGIGDIVNVSVRAIITLGATGGLRALFSTPSTSDANTTTQLFDTVTPAVISNVNLSATVFNNALAVAGNHILLIQYSGVMTAAGTFAFQVAQNTSDVLSLTVQQGSFMNVVTL